MKFKNRICLFNMCEWKDVVGYEGIYEANEGGRKSGARK